MCPETPFGLRRHIPRTFTLISRLIRVSIIIRFFLCMFNSLFCTILFTCVGLKSASTVVTGTCILDGFARFRNPAGLQLRPLCCRLRWSHNAKVWILNSYLYTGLPSVIRTDCNSILAYLQSFLCQHGTDKYKFQIWTIGLQPVITIFIPKPSYCYYLKGNWWGIF